MSSTRLTARMSRLLNLVPYFVANPGISVPAAAAELGVSKKQLMDDLNQLWLCGLPGYGPGDLIDLAFSEESVEVTFSAGIERPLRLTSIEATALLMALRSLAELPGMVDPAAAQAAVAKIETAAGQAAALAAGRTLPTAVTEDPAAAAIRSALHNGHALRLVYYSASRDTVTERVVDPVRVLLVDNNSYLSAWSREAEGMRLFRFDRVEQAAELDEPAQVPEGAAAGDSALELFGHDSGGTEPGLPVARLWVRGDHAWIAEQYPVTDLEVGPDGSLELSLRYATLEWLVRLVLGFGPAVRPLSPPALVTAVRERAAAALAVGDLVQQHAEVQRDQRHRL